MGLNKNYLQKLLQQINLPGIFQKNGQTD